MGGMCPPEMEVYSWHCHEQPVNQTLTHGDPWAPIGSGKDDEYRLEVGHRLYPHQCSIWTWHPFPMSCPKVTSTWEWHRFSTANMAGQAFCAQPPNTQMVCTELQGSSGIKSFHCRETLHQNSPIFHGVKTNGKDMGVSINGGTHIAGCFIGENPI